MNGWAMTGLLWPAHRDRCDLWRSTEHGSFSYKGPSMRHTVSLISPAVTSSSGLHTKLLDPIHTKDPILQESLTRSTHHPPSVSLFTIRRIATCPWRKARQGGLGRHLHLGLHGIHGCRNCPLVLQTRYQCPYLGLQRGQGKVGGPWREH